MEELNKQLHEEQGKVFSLTGELKQSTTLHRTVQEVCLCVRALVNSKFIQLFELKMTLPKLNLCSFSWFTDLSSFLIFGTSICFGCECDTQREIKLPYWPLICAGALDLLYSVVSSCHSVLQAGCRCSVFVFCHYYPTSTNQTRKIQLNILQLDTNARIADVLLPCDPSVSCSGKGGGWLRKMRGM